MERDLKMNMDPYLASKRSPCAPTKGQQIRKFHMVFDMLMQILNCVQASLQPSIVTNNGRKVFFLSLYHYEDSKKIIAKRSFANEL